MNKTLVAAIVLLVAIGIAAPKLKDAYDTSMYLAKTDGYAEAKAKFQPKADPYVQTFAEAFCADNEEVMIPYLEAVSARYGFTPQELLADSGLTPHTCVEVRFVGSFRDALRNDEYIYIIDNGEVTHWFVITFDSENNVVSVK